MDMVLDLVEARVLGALIEKELTTPEYYPLTLNSLKAACNQKSNRNPVMALEDKDLVRALDSLRQKNLVYEKSVPGGRVYKYEHRFSNWVPFSPEEVAVLCALILRGPQTVGEIKSRTNRLFDFAATDQVEDVLAELMAHESGCFVKELPLQAGRREHRYAQLLTGDVELTDDVSQPAPEPARVALAAEEERINQLEAEVARLSEELTSLQKEFEAFRSQFD